MSSIRLQLYTKAKEIGMTEGWSKCLQLAARSLDISPLEISQHFPNGNYDVIKSLMEEWNKNLISETKKPSEISAQSIISVGTKRLSSMLPYSEHWAEAMAIGAQPANILTTTNLLWDTFDTILYQAGDVFDPFRYHAKRMTIGSLFVATETLMAKNPSNSESSLVYFSAGVHQVDRLEKIGKKVCVLSTFFAEAGYSMGYSFVAQPTTHVNPMPRPDLAFN